MLPFEKTETAANGNRIRCGIDSVGTTSGFVSTGSEGAGSLAVTSDFDNSVYPTEALAQQGEILANADFARFDGSDLMPGEVGGGAFWEQMVAWVSGNQDLDTTLQNIDSAWPEDSA